MGNILSDTYLNLNNWTKNMNSFPVFENTYQYGINTLQFQGGSGYEKLYMPITVEQNHNYQFKFNFYSSTGFQIGNSGNSYALAFIRTSAPSDTSAALSKTNLVISEPWDNNVNNESKQYIMSFNSGNYTQLYVALDFGYILDGVTYTYVFSDFELDDCNELEIGALYMPNMKDVNICFDARVGVSDTEWQNLKGDIHFQLFNPTRTENGLELGNSPAYGKITIPYVSGSSRTRYYIFKNLSGVFQEWRTIIDDEVSTYRCATVAMNSSGYIQFCRPNIGTNYKCTDWHVIAITDNGSSRRRKFWIDGNYIGYTNNMDGWADNIYLGRGSGWDYPNNLTAFRVFIIASSMHSDADVVLNSQWLYDAYIRNYKSEIDADNKYYLIQDKDNIFYSLKSGNLENLGNQEINSELFLNYGLVNILPTWEQINTLINPKILLWRSYPKVTDNLLKMTSYMQAITSPQILITNKIDLNDTNDITGIKKVTVDNNGDILFAVSFDEKKHWLFFNENEWNIASNELEGMNKTTLEAITSDQWAAALGESKIIYFKAIFSNAIDTLREINIEFLKS